MPSAAWLRSGAAQNCTPLDDLIGEGEQSIRHCNAERFRSFDVDPAVRTSSTGTIGRSGGCAPLRIPAGKVFCSITVLRL
jgi:hypothetical protein